MICYHFINKFCVGGGELVGIQGHLGVKGVAMKSTIVSVRNNNNIKEELKRFEISRPEVVELGFDRRSIGAMWLSLKCLVDISKKIKMAGNVKTVIHSHCELPDLFCLILKVLLLRRENVKFVRTIHNDRYFGVRFGWVLDNVVSAFFDHTICISHKTTKNLKFINKKSLIYNPVRTVSDRQCACSQNKVDNYAAKRQLKIAVIGRLSDQKQQIPLLRKLSANESQHEFYFYGFNELDIPEGAPAIPSCVVVMGFEKEVLKIYSEMDVVYIPSIYEGLSTVMVEALMSRTPVFSHIVSGVSDVGNLLTYDLSVKNFSEFIIRLSEIGLPVISDDEVAALKEMFSPENYTKKLVELYHEVG